MIGLEKDKSEKERLFALSQYNILDTTAEKELDAITRLASYICKTPIALISFVEENRQWFKSKVGIDHNETPRKNSLCHFTIQSDNLLEISDIPNDAIFSKVELDQAQGLRFYAGFPLISPSGYRIGTLCVADFSPRSLSEEQKDALATLANQVISHLETSRKNHELQGILSNYKQIFSLFNNSPELHAILDDNGTILVINNSVERHLGYSPEEVIGKNIWDFSMAEDREKAMPAIEQGLVRGETYFELETRLITKTGEFKWFGWQDKKEGDRWLINGRDITEKKKTTEDLQLLSLVARSVNNGVVISDAENNAIWVNDAFEKITGYCIDDILGKKIGDVLKGPDTDEKVIDTAREYYQNKKAFDIELLCYRKDGTPIWLSIFSSVILNSAGEVDKEVEIILDITERKQVEEELRTLSVAATKTSTGLIIRDPQNEVLWTNNAFESISGYALAELKGKMISDLMVGAETDPKIVQKAMAAIHSRQPYDLEMILHKKDGTPIWLYVSNNPIFNDFGQMEKQIAIVVDITERKKSEEQVKLLSLVASHTANGVAIADKDGLVTWVNASYEKITGYSLADIQGKQAGDLLFGDGTNLEEVEKARRLAAELKPYDLEILNYRKDGEPVWLSVSNTPVFDSNGIIIHQVEIVNDITIRKYTEFELVLAKEEALQLSKAKEMFLSVMSHEIRTPLNAVLGLSRILHEESTSPSQAESLSLLKFSAENLMALINDILDLTKIETGNLELESIDVSIKDLVSKTMSSLQFKAHEKGVVFKSEIDPRIPDVIQADDTRLYQILMNLLGNAVKFTERGEIGLKLDLVDESSDIISLKFEVSDTGIGIPNDKLDQIFEVYKQAGSDTSRKYGGTGLGLSITKRLVELHNSQIAVESKVGVGTKFTFVIDFKRSKPSRSAVESGVIYQLKGRVLVADDNQINCFLARKVLTKWGIDVDFAENGKQAIEKIINNSYNLVLMDIQMPVMNGFEAAKAIRALNNGMFKDLPIIALTATALSEDLQSIRSAGMNGHVLKPFVPTELYTKIETYFERENKM